MAIRPIKHINDLNIEGLKNRFKNYREIENSLIFSTIFISSLEYLLIYLKGTCLQAFLDNFFSNIEQKSLENCKEQFSGVFEDFSDMISKRQLKILTTMIYDSSFAEFLNEIINLLELPVSKSSANESFSQILHIREKLKINITLIDQRKNEKSITCPDFFINLFILTQNDCYSVLYPYQYEGSFLLKSPSKAEEESEEDMRKLNLPYQQNSYRRSDSKLNYLSKSTSPFKPEKNDKESRMKNRALLLKAKREQQKQEELQRKIEQQKIIEKEKEISEALKKEQELEDIRKEEIRLKLEEENKRLREWKEAEDRDIDERKQVLREQVEREKQRKVEESLKSELLREVEQAAKIQEKRIAEELKVLEENKRILEEKTREQAVLDLKIKLDEDRRAEENRKLEEEREKIKFERMQNEKILEMERVRIESIQIEEERKINEEVVRFEERMVYEEIRLEKERQKLYERKLLEDKKIAEEKRVLAETRLEKMKKLLLERSQASTPSFPYYTEQQRPEDITKEPEHSESNLPNQVIQDQCFASNNHPDKSIKSNIIKHAIVQLLNIKKRKKPLKKEKKWIDLEKEKIEAKKSEIENILIKTRKLEEKRKSFKYDSPFISPKKLEISKSPKRVHSSYDRPKPTRSRGSVIDQGFFDEIFNKNTKPVPDISEQVIQELRAFSSIKILDQSPVFDKKQHIENTEIASKEQLPKIKIFDNKSFCGGLYCEKCVKDLKKSDLLLFCQDCCAPLDSKKVEKSTRKKTQKKLVCMKCSSKILKGEEVLCICCFIKVNIFKQDPTCLGCSKISNNFWVDPNYGNDLDLFECSFCYSLKNKISLVKICESCSDLICLVCLRKNLFVAEGICSTCHSRRQVTLIY